MRCSFYKFFIIVLTCRCTISYTIQIFYTSIAFDASTSKINRASLQILRGMRKLMDPKLTMQNFIYAEVLKDPT